MWIRKQNGGFWHTYCLLCFLKISYPVITKAHRNIPKIAYMHSNVIIIAMETKTNKQKFPQTFLSNFLEIYDEFKHCEKLNFPSAMKIWNAIDNLILVYTSDVKICVDFRSNSKFVSIWRTIMITVSLLAAVFGPVAILTEWFWKDIICILVFQNIFMNWLQK